MNAMDLLVLGIALLIAAFIAFPLLIVLGIAAIIMALVRVARGERL